MATPVYLDWSQICDLCALELPVHDVLPWSSSSSWSNDQRQLLSLVDPGTPKRHRRSLLLMARELVNCSSVDRCSQLWSFMATLHVKSHPRSSKVWMSLWHHIGGRMMDLRRAELMQKTDFSGRLSEASEESSVLLLAAHAPGYFERRDVAPFLRQLECYAAKRQMRFAAVAGPWPVKHEKVAIVELMWNLHQFWTTQRPAAASAASAAWNARDQDLHFLLHDLITRRRLGRSAELLAYNADVLNVFHEDPSKMYAKIWAIEQELANESVDMVIYLDADMTLRPDAREWGLVPFLTRGNESGHIFVRDSFTGTECVNTGFLGFRNTAVSKRILQLWKQKTNWSMFWDQNFFAESILELVGMEMEELGRPGYNSQCVRYLFPFLSGIVPDTMYCDCWQAKLAEMIGPYRQRSSRLVSFLDPEHVDVNFVPNDIFWNHGFKLKDMFLDSRHAKIMNPLITHWAGMLTSRQRVALARTYLKDRFNASFSEEEICNDSLPVPMPPPSFASNARYIKCCKSVGHRFRMQGFVEPRDLCYWGCCDWEPLQLDDCWKYI